jgi:hypothetical protein
LRELFFYLVRFVVVYGTGYGEKMCRKVRVQGETRMKFHEFLVSQSIEKNKVYIFLMSQKRVFFFSNDLTYAWHIL